MKQIAMISLLAVFLSACASLEENATRNSLKSLNSDGEYVEDVKIAKISKNQIPTLLTQFLQAKKAAITKTGVTSVKGRKPKANGKQFVYDYVSLGIELSDSYCQALFSRQFNFERETNHQQRNIRLIGDIALAGMGLHGQTSPSALAGWALGFSSVDRFQENYKQTYFLSDAAVYTVEEKVEAARRGNADTLRTKAKANEIEVEIAAGLLAQYHDSCSIKSIQSFIAKSVDLSHYTANSKEFGPSSFDGVIQSNLSKGDIDRLSKALNAQLGFNSAKTIPADYLRAVYSQAMHPSSKIAVAEANDPASIYSSYISAYISKSASAPTKKTIGLLLSELNAHMPLESAHKAADEKQEKVSNLPPADPGLPKAKEALKEFLLNPLNKRALSSDMGISVSSN